MNHEQPTVMEIDEDDEVSSPLATGKFADLLETVAAMPVVEKEHLVGIREQSGDTLWFKMHTFTKLRKAMVGRIIILRSCTGLTHSDQVVYCDRRGYKTSDLRFTFKGEEVLGRWTPGVVCTSFSISVIRNLLTA
jgi:hypothetical protein